MIEFITSFIETYPIIATAIGISIVWGFIKKSLKFVIRVLVVGLVLLFILT